VATTTWLAAACFPHVLQGLLGDPQHDGLLGVADLVRRGRQIGRDRHADQALHVLGVVDDRAVEAEVVEQRRPELADERPDVTELAPQELAQVAQLGPGQGRVGVDDPLDVLDLEDRVAQGLRRAVVDLLGEAGSARPPAPA
jgi:hypothetical protein